MPQMGVSVSEGTIVEWRKRPGDWIEADEMVCDITTDKIDVEVPSPATGRLARIVAEPGDTVPVGEPIAEIDTGARPGEAHPEEEASGNGSTEADREVDRSKFYSPVVRRMAAEHGVDLEQVEGTGVGGRVKKSDLVAFLESRPAEREAEEERPEPVLHSESPYKPDEPAAEHEPAVTDGERREPMSEMRKAIARHMVESRRTSAHCTTIVEADFSRVAARRAELRETMRRRGVNLTYLAFVARATVEALEEFPRLNASLDGEELVLHDDVNLGIAVALDGGLIVPVIKQAQRLSLEGMAAAIADVAERAREGQLEPDDVHGGTFTITNPGQFGAVLATPIINQPQVAILDLEAIVKRPVVVSGPDGEDAIAIRPMSYLCMSWDHRALDGAEAARFLSRIKEKVEAWGASR
jgi:2-oxoglutarate dehydrogenase complex dihydrolipoamide succinyltransferase (E2) component